MSNPLQNIFDLRLSPRLLIEASAGTGKTYTIVGIFIRLLIEKKLPPEQILVVTFTRMATKELKDRILERLRESLAALESNKTHDDDFLNHLLDWSRSYPDAELLLRQAIRNFDDAQVHTIHGFCQKVLKEEALLTGAPFEIEVSQTDDLLSQAAEDFWRSFIHRHSDNPVGRYYLNKVFKQADSPEKLLNVLMPVLNKEYGVIEGVKDIKIREYLDEVIRLRAQMKEIWQGERQDILRQLLESDVKGLGETTVQKRGEEFDSFFEEENFETDTFGNLKKTASSYLNDDANLKSKGHKKPNHRFFDLCQEYHTLIREIDQITGTFLFQAATSIKQIRDKQAEAAGFYSYDDLLKQLSSALKDEDSGPALARKLQQQYPFALVDEFQDTDPVQYQIFDHIYSEKPDSSLMMIGDPKQAIYGFRGADIYTYLQAGRKVQKSARYTLQRNFRSSENLIRGINALFSQSGSPFIEEEIEFIPSEAGNKNNSTEYRVDGEGPVPFKFQLKAGIHSTDEARNWAFDQAAQQTARLITKGRNGEALIDGRNLTGGDIAILISSHKDAEDLKQRLHNLGVDAVTYSRKNVFESDEAPRLELLMAAILDPADLRAVRNALISGFFGRNLNEIYDLQQNESKHLEISDLLFELRECWQKYGFYPAYRKLMMEYGAQKHFTDFQNSERMITNLQQLAELCAFAERDHHLDGPSLLNWFRKRMLRTSDDEEGTLRLESDQDLVKISTIHNSKGLEFPVVFCPTLWYARDVKNSVNGIVGYHGEKGGLRFNFEQQNSPERKSAYNQYLFECVAEEVRKTYVALTRAKYECRVFWAAVNATPFSGFGASLIGRQKVAEFVKKKYKLYKHPGVNDETFLSRIKMLSEKFPCSFQIADDLQGDGDYSFSEEQDAGNWSVRKWNGAEKLQPSRNVSSFSSLVHHQNDGVTEPDYDQWLDEYLQLSDPDQKESEMLDIFSFPRGAAAGTVIHKLFEHENFDFRKSEYSANREFIAEVLAGYGMDEKWVPVMRTMLERVCHAKIGELDLSRIAPEDQLREMEFNMPVYPPDMEAIYSIIRSRDSGRADSAASKGYLTGFIDLLVRQNGKYYILDYKSNYLGDSVKDYNREALLESVQSSGYDVQYHFYILALVEMLRWKMPRFEYEKHFGGVAYLYIRGMRKGSANGVWFHKPEEAVIRNLQTILKRKK